MANPDLGVLVTGAIATIAGFSAVLNLTSYSELASRLKGMYYIKLFGQLNPQDSSRIEKLIGIYENIATEKLAIGIMSGSIALMSGLVMYSRL